MSTVFELPNFVYSISLIAGTLVALMGMVSVFWGTANGRGSGGGIILLLAGVMIAGLPGTFTMIFNTFDTSGGPSDETEDDSTPDETEPEPEPTQEPADPMDLTFLWAILIIAASLAILAGLGYVTYRVFTSAKRKRKVTKQALAETAARWAAARDLHAEALTTVASYELDVAKAIDFPAFNDISVPEVSAMSKAMRRARDVEFQIDKDSEIGGSDDLLATYRDAVDEFVTSVEIAEAKARQIRWKSVPKEEQKLMRQAKHLLIQAEDPGNPEKMRHTLYERLKKTIDQLNEAHGSRVVPTKTIGEIEEQTRLLLEAPETGVTAEDMAHESIRL